MIIFEIALHLVHLLAPINASTMDQKTQFWERIFQLMTKEHGHGSPNTWTKPVSQHFLDRFHQRLAAICEIDEAKAARCQAIGGNGEIQPPTIGYTTFYRITRQGGKGDRRTRDLFAIYYGSASYHAFLEDQNILSVVSTETVDHKSQKGSKRKWLVLLLPLFFILLATVFFFAWGSMSACSTYVIGPNQFLLVRTDDGINFIDPTKSINQVLAKGPYFTGFGYDQGDRILFWSNTDHNYRTIGRADLSNGLLDENLNHRFIKDLPYPLGIALDTSKNILYLADYGTFNQLDDGSIRAYDYDGNLLQVIYEDCIDPSSIILDPKSQTLFWTDPRKHRIGRYDLIQKTCDPDFLVNIGSNPDGMVHDNALNRLYWASNKDSLIGWVDLGRVPSQPKLMKLQETATALAINPITRHLFYTSYDQEKIKWFHIEGDSFQQSDCGQIGIQTDAGSPGVVQLFTQ